MGYDIGSYEFNLEEFFPESLFYQINSVRADCPTVVEEEAKARKRRETLTLDGKLTILAADHPARMVTKSGDDPIIMGNRQQYLGRILRVIMSPEFDGIMGTPDVLEELLIVDYLIKNNGGESFLDNKVMLGCMNRGGLAGVAFEMDDRYTAFTAERISEMRLDGAKVMFRVDPTSPESGKTLGYTAEAITDCNLYGLPIFVEPLPVERTEAGFKVKKTAADLIKVMGVASGLGDSSMGIWLKIPYCENYESVAKATTCPILMLGGESKGNPTPVIEEFAKGMQAGANVRGALVGRNVHFPGKDDPYAVALAINNIVHKGFTAEQAVDFLQENRGREMDRLTRHIS